MNSVNTLAEKFKNPVVSAIFALVIGFGLGLFWGWKVDPVVYYDTVPELLTAEHQRDYLKMTIDSFMVNSDTALATQRWQNLGEKAPLRLEEISQDPTVQDKASIAAFGKLMNATSPTQTDTTQTNTEKSSSSSFLKFLFILVGILAIAAVAYYIIRLLRPNIAKRSAATPAQQAAQISQSTEKTDYSEMGLATPITQSMTSYVLGDDLYDESFSIESQAGEFMGEYGVGISETIGVGAPKKVTALEIWLFDKNDIKTATKVLMSEHAYNDPNIRQRLEAKGELVVIDAKKQVMLETETLQLLVTVADLEYGSGPLPPRSYFDRTTLELAVWPKAIKG
jgi:hypothetical protein